ncbi:MAG: SAF domain-containing protein [Clostridia bacterium]|nr:SAF domain-containing protein [Clostridia bacterium]
MAMNPMQRKANNSFLIGVLITLLICGVIIVFLFMQLSKLNEEKKTREQSAKVVYVVASTIESGDEVTVTNLKELEVDGAAVPEDVATASDITENTIAKIDMKVGTVVSKNMITTKDNPTTDDLRTQEYNIISLPTELYDEDYVDIRLRLPSGQDFIVISKKSVMIPEIAGVKSTTTITMKLTEGELITMSNAIVENYTVEGSLLYATKYVEPGLQKLATATYVPSGAVQQLIYSNPNIVSEAKNGLISRYNSNVQMREYINASVGSASTESADRIQTGTETEITTSRTERETYLQSLAGF